MRRALPLLAWALLLPLLACGLSAAPSGSGSSAAAPAKPAVGALGGAAQPTAPAAQAPAGTSPGAEPIQFTLDWVVFGRHAGYFVALDKGYYSENGLTVSISRGYGGADSIKRAAAGTAQFVFGDSASLVLARANDEVTVKTIGMIYARPPHLLFYFTDRGINSPKDLEGRTISAPAGDAIRSMFPAFARAAGIDANRVNWQTIEPTAKYPLMMAGQAEISTELSPAVPLLEKQAAEAGKTLATMRYADYGLDLYSNALMATESYLAEKPDVARRFLAATMRGWTYASENQEEAANILRKYHPEVDATIARQEVAVVQQLATSDEARTNGLGYMSLDKMRSTRDLVAAAFPLQRTVEPEELFTNEFLPRR